MPRVFWGGAVVFGLFALLQLNDPDGGVWIFVYTITALYAGASARGRMSRPVALTWGVLALCMATMMLAMTPPLPAPEADASLERTFEMGGLLLVGLFSFVMAWHAGPVSGDP